MKILNSKYLSTVLSFPLTPYASSHASNKENTKPFLRHFSSSRFSSQPQPNLNLTSPYTSLQVFLSHNTTGRGAQRGQKWQPKPVIRNLRGTIGVSNAITLFRKRGEPMFPPFRQGWNRLVCIGAGGSSGEKFEIGR